MEISVIIWIIYAIGVMAAMVLFIDDAYEESWKHNMSPSEYLGQENVLRNIILSSIGSWLAVLYRCQKKKLKF